MAELPVASAAVLGLSTAGSAAASVGPASSDAALAVAAGRGRAAADSRWCVCPWRVGAARVVSDAPSRSSRERASSLGVSSAVVAALSLAAGSRHFNMPNKTERRLARLLAAQIPPPTSLFKRITLLSARQRLIRYNDSFGTSHQEVIALFDRSIHYLASEASACVSA